MRHTLPLALPRAMLLALALGLGQGLLLACQSETQPAVEDAAATEETSGTALADTCGAACAEPLPLCTPLLALDTFRILADTEDPWDDRPATAKCQDWAVHFETIVEEPALSIATGACSYVSAQGALTQDVPAGTPLELRFFHFSLTAAEPAEAHAAIRLGDQTVLDERVPIPSESGMLQAVWDAPTALPAGTPVQLHLHNHGANSWAFLGIRTRCK